jgi:hypothetical protein
VVEGVGRGVAAGGEVLGADPVVTGGDGTLLAVVSVL